MRIFNSAIVASRTILWLAMSIMWSTAQAAFIGYDAENDLMLRHVSTFSKAKNMATVIVKETSFTNPSAAPIQTLQQINKLSYKYGDGNFTEFNIKIDSGVPSVTYKSSIGEPANSNDGDGASLHYMAVRDVLDLTQRRDGNDIDTIHGINAAHFFLLSHKAFDDSSNTTSVRGIFANGSNSSDNKFTNYSSLSQKREPYSAAQTDSFVLWVLYKLVAFGVSEVIATIVIVTFSFGAIMRLFEKTPNGN